MESDEPEGVGYVLTLGEAMGLISCDGGFAVALGATVGIGGAESNVAIGLVRLGVAATWVGRVGDDSLGARVLRELRAEGVRTVAVVDPSAPTGLMLKERRTPLTTDVQYHRSGSAGSRLASIDVPDGLVEAAALLHVTGITPALSPAAADALHSTLERAAAAGVPIAFDVNHRSRLWSVEGTAVATYRAVAGRCQVLFAGVDEAALLVGAAGSGGSDGAVALARAVVEIGPAEVVIKDGARGAVALVGDAVHEQSAYPVPVVDTVGAGDAFVAGYLAERLAGSSVDRRLDVAARAGAFACMSRGDWEGMPTRRDIERLDADDPVTR